MSVLHLSLLYLSIISLIRNQGKMSKSKGIRSDIVFTLARKIDNAMSAREIHTATSMVLVIKI